MRFGLSAITIMAAAGATLVAATPLLAQVKFSNGTYVVEDGSYSIEVEQEGDHLVVVEPNKRSEYLPKGPGVYHFYNPNTDTVYGIRVLDDHTIEAFKPYNDGNVPTRLVRLGGAPAAQPEPSPVDPNRAVAEAYRARAQSDPDNAQAWTACSAAALKRSAANKDEADAYGLKMAEILSVILVDPSHSPCEDAIPASLWHPKAATSARPSSPQPSTEAAEESAAPAPSGSLSEVEKARLQKLNELEDARFAAAKVEAERRRQEQIAYEKRLAEVKKAQAEYEAAKAAHDAEVIKSREAEADYQRKRAEYERLLASGKFATPN